MDRRVKVLRLRSHYKWLITRHLGFNAKSIGLVMTEVTKRDISLAAIILQCCLIVFRTFRPRQTCGDLSAKVPTGKAF